MASTRQLKTRIRSVKSTKQLTKAMQMVAASKMRRAQGAEKASDPYTNAAKEILSYLASQGVTATHPFFQERPIKNRLLIVITSDKGLAGAYNANVLKRYLNELQEDVAAGITTSTIAIGRKAAQLTSKLKDAHILGVYEDLPDVPATDAMRALLSTVRIQFRSEQVDAVDVIYTNFKSSMTQEVMTTRVLPAGTQDDIEAPQEVREATFEPGMSSVLDGVAVRFVDAQIFQAYLDGKASEYSMRMIAMKNATDNATDLVDDLTLEMNKARQGAITQELAEISGGVEALNQ